MLPKEKTKPKHLKKENQTIYFFKRVKEEPETIKQGKKINIDILKKKNCNSSSISIRF